jgi:hypothetical protein
MQRNGRKDSSKKESTGITSNDLQLIKIIDQMGNTRFSVKNPDGTFQAENLSRLRLRLDFPDLENQIDKESTAKS